MSLKGLSSFQRFDGERFFHDKQILFTKAEDWQEGEDAEHMRSVGTKITGVILSDETNYGHDQKGINQGESLTFKVRQPLTSFTNWKVFQTIFTVEKIEKATVWGDYRNQLSIKVPSLKEIQN